MRMLDVLVGLLLVGLGACTAEDGGREITRTRSGDTTTVQIPAGWDSVTVPVEVEVIWQSPDLGEPTTLVATEDLLFIADMNRIHVVHRGGDYVRTLGREGEGPGEFRAIGGVGLREDSLLVVDTRNDRLTFLTWDGDLLGTHRLGSHEVYRNMRREEPLALFEDGILVAAEENVRRDRRTRAAVLWYGLSGDSVREVASFPHVEWREYGSILGEVELLGPRALIAVAPNGRFAHGTGRDPCVTVQTVGKSGALQVCRDRARAPIGPGVRNVRPEDVAAGGAIPDAVRGALQTLYDEQVIPEYYPMYDRLLFGAGGSLWVRVTGSDPPDVHPAVQSRQPTLGPKWRVWERYGLDGTPEGMFRLPGSFRPVVFEAESTLGFVTLPTGEVAVAVGRWQGV